MTYLLSRLRYILRSTPLPRSTRIKQSAIGFQGWKSRSELVSRVDNIRENSRDFCWHFHGFDCVCTLMGPLPPDFLSYFFPWRIIGNELSRGARKYVNLSETSRTPTKFETDTGPVVSKSLKLPTLNLDMLHATVPLGTLFYRETRVFQFYRRYLKE